MLLRILLVFVVFLFYSMSVFGDELAIKTIAYEASNQPFSCQIGIASVIKTRMEKRNLTLKEVIFQPYQFSSWNFRNKTPTQSRELTKQEIIQAKKAWELGKVWEYNHFCNYDNKPKWVQSSKKSKRIGDIIFYKI